MATELLDAVGCRCNETEARISSSQRSSKYTFAAHRLQPSNVSLEVCSFGGTAVCAMKACIWDMITLGLDSGYCLHAVVVLLCL